MDRELALKDRAIEARCREVEARDRAIRVKDRTIEAKSLPLAQQERTIEALSAQIAAIQAENAAKDQAIGVLAGDLEYLQSGMAWKVARTMQKARAGPPRTGPSAIATLRLALKGALVWKREGFPTFVGRGTRKAVRIAGRMVRRRPPVDLPPPQPAAENPPQDDFSPIGTPQAPIQAEVAYYEQPALTLPAEMPPYEAWLRNNRWNDQAMMLAEHALRKLPRRPRFSIVMPVYNIEDFWLEKAIASVQAQVYPNWELCIADDASTQPNVRPFLQRVASRDPRIRVRYLAKNGNISVASNAAAELARGEYIVLLDHDDELTPDCLLELARAITSEGDPDIVYSDDDKINEHGQRFGPQFKPDWSPELLLAYMYITHVFCFRRELFEEVGGFREGFEGCQDYDLALRMTERTGRIAHIPKILYHWRALPTSTASSGAAKPEAFDRGIRAVQEALDRRKIAGRVSRPGFAEEGNLGLFQIDFADEGPSVAIVVPTKNRLELIRPCIQSILEKTTYTNYEIIVIDNESDDPATLRYLKSLGHPCRVMRIASIDGKFSYARLNNLAVAELDHDYILFLNNDTEVRRPEWLSQMVGYAQIPGVGAVGARFIFPDGRLQHAGVVTGYGDGLPLPAFKLLPCWDPGYMGFTMVSRNYSAVTAACLLTPRELFLSIGGFDEERFAVAYNDVDLCLRLREGGWRSVYAPAPS